MSKTITALNLGRIDKCEKYAIKMVEVLLGYKVEKYVTYVFKNENGRKIKEVTINETERMERLTEKRIS